MAIAAVQHLPHVNHINQLTQVERYRLIEFNQEIRNTIDGRQDLNQNQKDDLIDELAERTTQVAFQRHFFREAPNIALRGINLQTTPPDTLCETFLKGSVFAAGGAAIIHEPIITGVVVGTVYASSKLFDDECCLNKFFRWLGCSKPADQEVTLPPLVAPQLNNNAQ